MYIYKKAPFNDEKLAKIAIHREIASQRKQSSEVWEHNLFPKAT